MKIRDGDWVLFDWCPRTGRSVWYCEDGPVTHWRTDQPVDTLIEANAVDQADRPVAASGIGRRIASIPLGMFEDKLAAPLGEGDDRYIARWLNDGDNRAFRTSKDHL